MEANMSAVMDFAKRLDGREYGKEISRAEEKEAKASGLVVVFGASDDLMEICGAAYDEIPAFGGAVAYFDMQGTVVNGCNDPNCPYFKSAKKRAATIKAIWDSHGYSWTYETAIPHATFDILEDGGKYCRGLVFALADVKAAEGSPEGA